MDFHFEECPGTARVPSSTMHVGAESATAWSLCRPASAAAALSLRKGLMLGAWWFAEYSSRAPGARWGGAVDPPSLCVALVTASVTRASAALRGADGRAGRAAGRR